MQVKTMIATCAACAACGDECERHASMHEHCKICADACRRWEQACHGGGGIHYAIRPKTVTCGAAR
jgi:hypothetical protein